MQIEFNTSRLAKQDAAQPAASPAAGKTTSADTASFSSASSLESQLNDVSQIRPDKVQAAKALIADPTYPPDEVLDGISKLLALKIKQ